MIVTEFRSTARTQRPSVYSEPGNGLWLGPGAGHGDWRNHNYGPGIGGRPMGSALHPAGHLHFADFRLYGIPIASLPPSKSR
jgi:hypothetical protein